LSSYIAAAQAMPNVRVMFLIVGEEFVVVVVDLPIGIRLQLLRFEIDNPGHLLMSNLNGFAGSSPKLTSTVMHLICMVGTNENFGIGIGFPAKLNI
jgi:hypothetical protein